MLGDLGASVLDLALAAGGGDDFQGAQDGHAGAHQGRVGAAEAGERNLVHEIAEDGRLHEEVVLLAATIRRRDILARDEIHPVGAKGERPPPRLHEIAQVDQELGGSGELGAEIRKHGGKHRDDKDQQHVDQRHREADDRDRIGHGGLDLLGQLDRGLEIAGHLAENLGEAAGRFTGLHHGDEKIRIRLGEFLDRSGERRAGGDVIAHIADDDAENLVLRLVLQGLQTGDERQAGLQQGGELAGKDREFTKAERVGLGLLL